MHNGRATGPATSKHGHHTTGGKSIMERPTNMDGTTTGTKKIHLNLGATAPYTPPQTANFAPASNTAGIPPPTHTGGGRGHGGRRGGQGRGGGRSNKNKSAYGHEPPKTGGDAAGGLAHNNP